MLSTPLGPIKVFADGTKLDCEVMEFTYDRPPVKGHPIAGCYRIHAPVGEHRSIRCEVELSDTRIVNTGASGERYVDAEFISDSIILTIGAEDENPAFETVRVEFGLEYRILNSVSGMTGIFFPINAVTVLIAGFLGLPGMALMALVSVLPG